MKIGVLGGGQLGRMLALAAYELGLRLRFYDTTTDAPAGHLAELHVGAFDDHERLARFADGLDAITYEFENVPAATAEFLAKRAPVYPPQSALQASQDRLSEKTLFQRIGLPTPRFAPIASEAELAAAANDIGFPCVLKTRRMGYDGKGQALLRTAPDVPPAFVSIGAAPGGLILEQFVKFEREVSVIVARARDGAMRVYPLIENRHEGGILRVSRAPAPNVSPHMQALAERHARSLVETLGYVGVTAIELFQVSTSNGVELWGNEFAPRVHNSGHWTIEGAACSQFENHIRAVAGLPLGDASAIGHSVMLNLIGDTPARHAVLATPGAHLHLYGKSPRPGRKVGHITVCADNPAELDRRAADLCTRTGLRA